MGEGVRARIGLIWVRDKWEALVSEVMDFSGPIHC
jgi:hypothetical protein